VDDLREELPLLLERVPGAVHRYKVSREGRFLGWVELRAGWWYGDRADKEPLPQRYRLRRDALERLEELGDAAG